MLTLFHTAATNEPLFAALLHDIAPDIPVRHIVDETILPHAREHGVDQQLQQRVTDTILGAVNDGSDVVLCTCSTIGGCAEATQSLTDKAVQRVDRAMAEKAVNIGSRILVAATLASTLAPTCDLVRDAAAKAGKDIAIIEVLCANAWAKFEAGDREGYFADIAAELRNVATQGDVIVLAQASMAGAAALCSDLPIPVLSSPRLGVAAAVAAYRQATKE
ncbi:MAG TPA: aspartate/glutamate racemase family protein [Blastocatellia bacterium]|nr:aspartate/glutamate racemase family protein [Blastocatellia bacterium]